jgi:hypothetical protein
MTRGYPRWPPCGTAPRGASRAACRWARASRAAWTAEVSTSLAAPDVLSTEGTNIAIEYGHGNSWFTHQTLWFSIIMLVYQRVSTEGTEQQEELYNVYIHVCIYIYTHYIVSIVCFFADSLKASRSISCKTILWWTLNGAYYIVVGYKVIKWYTSDLLIWPWGI